MSYGVQYGKKGIRYTLSFLTGKVVGYAFLSTCHFIISEITYDTIREIEACGSGGCNSKREGTRHPRHTRQKVIPSGNYRPQSYFATAQPLHVFLRSVSTYQADLSPLLVVGCCRNHIKVHI